MAGSIIAAGYNNMEEITDASRSERAQLYKALEDGRPGWARPPRKMLDAHAPQTEVELGKVLLYKEVDIFAATKASKMLQGIGELSRPRQEAADLLSEALREGSRDCPQTRLANGMRKPKKLADVEMTLWPGF